MSGNFEEEFRQSMDELRFHPADKPERYAQPAETKWG